jgi:hypothetical protein
MSLSVLSLIWMGYPSAPFRRRFAAGEVHCAGGVVRVDALSSTSSLVDKIKKSENQARNPEFFKESKHLANLLQVIRYYAK